ncbi:MAG: hypothetical protein OXU68_00570 [Bacteroidota bacterium]|nr:hypothetical protein [Bacteroidota bacterium]
MPAAAEIWWSILLGVMLGLGYVTASMLVSRLARRSQRFVLVVLGGMLVRIAAAVVILVASALLLPVYAPAMIAAFLCVFLVGLGVEVLLILRKN